MVVGRHPARGGGDDSRTHRPGAKGATGVTDATRSPREPDDRDPLDLPELLELQEARVVAVDPEEARRQVPRQLTVLSDLVLRL